MNKEIFNLEPTTVWKNFYSLVRNSVVPLIGSFQL